MIVVTGATGLLGGHLTATLALQGRKVRALYRSKEKTARTREILSYYTKDIDRVFSTIEWIECDITDVFSVEDALEGADEVYHCAGLVSFHESDTKQLHKINAEGTANVVNIALEKKVKKFCHVSSVATLQVQANKKYIDELSVWKTSSGNSSYAISKYRGEFEAWRGLSEGLNVVVVNPSLIMGAGCWGQSSGELITRAYSWMPFYTEGVTGYVNVKDVVNCMIRLMDENKFGERYILNAENISFKEVINELRKNYHKSPVKLKAGKFIMETGRYADVLVSLISGKRRMITKDIITSALDRHYYDNSKICRELNYVFLPMQKTFREVCDAYVSSL
jgi:nucleoside-diphosphate-sugar epimerase